MFWGLHQAAESARTEGEAAREAWRCRICLSADVDAVLVRLHHPSCCTLSNQFAFPGHAAACLSGTITLTESAASNAEGIY